MRKIALILLLLSFAAFSAATDPQGTAQDWFTTATSSFVLELAKSWQILAAGAIFLSITLVAIAYMIGSGFEMPELQAWAKTEFNQIIVNALIVLSLFVVLGFIDILVIGLITETGAPPDGLDIPGCNLFLGGNSIGSVSCLKAVTTKYLDAEMYENIKSEARNILDNNVEDTQWIGRRFGLNCLSIVYCAQLGINMGFGGYYALYADMYAILFEHYATLLSFMGAQKFFVNEICFKMGPVVLAIGIVARSFFFTRKLGGLLMAAALGCMFFFPGMYIFDWLTLKLAINGDGVQDAYEDVCPAECKVPSPIAYIDEGGGNYLLINQSAQVADAFNDADWGALFASGNESATATADKGPYAGEVIHSCYWDVYKQCPIGCRELPYPTVPDCVKRNHDDIEIENEDGTTDTKREDVNVPLACSVVPDPCKIRRLVQVVDNAESDKCPTTCKVIPPLASTCNFNTMPDPAFVKTVIANADDNGRDELDYDLCLQSSYDCRMTRSNDTSWRPTKENAEDDAKDRCADAINCRSSLDAYQNCVYILPPVGRCNDLCGTCKAECRIVQFTSDKGSSFWSITPKTCKEEEEYNGDFNSDCNTCPEGCKVNLNELNTLRDQANDNGKCLSCPAQKMILSNSPALPPSYTAGSTCGLDVCPADYRLGIPRSACEMCIYSEEEYNYKPPINARCQDLCKPKNTRPQQDPSAFMKVGPTGLVGRTVIQDVSKYMIPVYLLPLFNVVATLIFIRSLSHFLGGDIEIPGLSKVF
ncbi:Uncharacterised protein [Candidatus Bilamarchaeum dharawalense]|uniref:Uncharacterized protein n=1 Tax=Candidatus Bilamarchaeum dharawalense TaxID=2885759 RepID=A0A5E4LTD6_9ARCH|nr:Uncharacterised protein [Candidatus Bilamarchaeum dharawalense]